MKKLGVVIFITLALVACAPAAGRPGVQLQGTTQDMINATVAACPTIAPANYNFLSVESIGDNFVSCRASVTTGVAILGALGGSRAEDQRLNVSFSAVSDNVVQVAISSFPRNTTIEDQLENALRVQFSLVD
jgi:hypothetical protein